LRSLKRYREALKPLEVAAALRPAEIRVAIALGWCYKRTHRLAQAIDALERACRHNPDAPGLLHYNLACYWSLAGNSNATSSSKLGTTNAVALRLFTNNAVRVYVASGGNVGIGTTSPS
jgi:tetratricopeptide (TPR) repeat protein